MAKGVAHAGKGTGLSSGNANENERRGWTEISYRRKNLEPLNNYDWSRHKLNFEIVDGKIRPLGSQKVSLYNRYQNLVRNLDYKEYKEGATNKQHSYVELILSGSTDKMQKIAFGDQTVSYERNPQEWRNWNVTRTAAIEEWALDVYKFVCDRYGKENIIGFEVHLDETEPHVHCNIVPTAIKMQRGNVSGYIKIDADGNPVTYTKGKHIGEVIKISEKKYEELSDEKKKEYRKNERGTVRVLSFATHFGDKTDERSKKMSELHDEYYNQVGKKWGFDRGDVIADLPDEEKALRKHYTKQQRRNIDLANKAQKEAQSKAKEEEAKLTEVTSAVEKQTQTLNSNNIKIEEQVSTIEQQNTTISENQAKIAQQEADMKKMTHGSMFDKMFRSGLTPEVKKAFEEKDAEHKEEMRQATMATYPNGKPIVWADGNKNGMQLTWEEYAKYLKEQEKKKEEQAKADKQAAVDQAKAEAKTKYDAALQKEKLAFNKDGDPIRWTGGSKKGQQVTKDERIDFLEKQAFKWEDAYNALVNRLKPARDLMFALLTLNFRKVVEIILDQWKAGLKEFAKDLKDFLLEAMKEEKTVKDRKLYVEDAFKGAKLIALTDAKWTAKEEDLQPLYDDAMRIADGTWESYHSNQKEKEAAVEAVASLANTPNRRYWQESDIRAVGMYLATVPAGELNAAINELKELAADEYNIRNEDWLNDVIKRLKDNSIVNGQGLGTGGR